MSRNSLRITNERDCLHEALPPVSCSKEQFLCRSILHETCPPLNWEPDNANVIADPERKLCSVSTSSIGTSFKYTFKRASSDEIVNGLFTI